MGNFIGSITAATEKGQRRYQEDRFLIHRVNHDGEREGTLLAVMDGHNGSGVAEFCNNNIPHLFSLQKGERAATALKRLVARLNTETDNMDSGSTLSLVYIPKNADRVHIAILGDSPVVLLGHDGNIRISPEHNVITNKAERAAAEKRGGTYSSGYIHNRSLYQGLQLGRALGDSWMGSVLSREPEIYSMKLGSRSIVIIASDGFTTARKRDGVDTIVRKVVAGADANEMMFWAKNYKRGGISDNATVIIWRGWGWKDA